MKGDFMLRSSSAATAWLAILEAAESVPEKSVFRPGIGLPGWLSAWAELGFHIAQGSARGLDALRWRRLSAPAPRRRPAPSRGVDRLAGGCSRPATSPRPSTSTSFVEQVFHQRVDALSAWQVPWRRANLVAIGVHRHAPAWRRPHRALMLMRRHIEPATRRAPAWRRFGRSPSLATLQAADADVALQTVGPCGRPGPRAGRLSCRLPLWPAPRRGGFWVAEYSSHVQLVNVQVKAERTRERTWATLSLVATLVSSNSVASAKAALCCARFTCRSLPFSGRLSWLQRACRVGQVQAAGELAGECGAGVGHRPRPR